MVKNPHEIQRYMFQHDYAPWYNLSPFRIIFSDVILCAHESQKGVKNLVIHIYFVYF